MILTAAGGCPSQKLVGGFPDYYSGGDLAVEEWGQLFLKRGLPDSAVPRASDLIWSYFT